MNFRRRTFFHLRVFPHGKKVDEDDCGTERAVVACYLHLPRDEDVAWMNATPSPWKRVLKLLEDNIVSIEGAALGETGRLVTDDADANAVQDHTGSKPNDNDREQELDPVDPFYLEFVRERRTHKYALLTYANGSDGGDGYGGGGNEDGGQEHARMKIDKMATYNLMMWLHRA
mgnify:CR=1 FL=1